MRCTAILLSAFCLLNSNCILPRGQSAIAASISASSSLNVVDSENLGEKLLRVDGHIQPLTGLITDVDSSEYRNQVLPVYEKRIWDYVAAAKAKNYDLQLALLRELRSICPDDLRAPYYLAGVLEKLQRYSEAADEYSRLCKRFMEVDAPSRFGRNNTSSCKVYLMTKEAACYRDRGDFNTAIGKFTQAFEADQSNVSALLGIAECQDAIGAKAAARDNYMRIMSQFPNSNAAAVAKENIVAVEKATREVLDGSAEHHGCWDFSRPLNVYIDSGKDCKFYEPYMRDMVVQALKEWNDASGNRLQFYVMPDSPLESAAVSNFEACGKDVVSFQDPIKCNIHIIWTDLVRGGHTLGVTGPCYSAGNALIQKQNIAIATATSAAGAVSLGNDSALAEAKEARKRSLYLTILHELGHALGLGHLSDSEAVMFYQVFGGISLDTTGRLRLSAQDVRALDRQYQSFHPSVLAGLQRLSPSRSIRYELPKAVGGRPSSASAVASSVYGNVSSYVPFSGSSSSGSSVLLGARTAGSGAPASNAWSQNVMSLIGKGDYKAALGVVNNALSGKPNDAEMHYIRGICLTRLKNYSEARTAYEKAIKLSPDSKTGSLARKGLEKLQ